MDDTLLELLTEIHRSIDRVADDLTRDRPELAAALRKEAAWIPRPEQLQPGGAEPLIAPSPPPSSRAACASLRPLLYRALDAGLVHPRRFDALMLRRARAARSLRVRES